VGKLILAPAVLLAALAIACGGDDESPPAATAEPEDEPTATASAGEDGGEQTFSSSQLPVSVTVTVPAGWEQPSDADLPDLFVTFKEGIGWVDFLQPTQVYNRASETQSELSEPPADYVAWFNENALVTVLSTEEATAGGLEGTRLEIKNDSYDFALFKLSDGSDYELNLSDHTYFHVLDANGTQILVSCGIERGGGDFAEFAETCGEILSTVEFEA
jgi:hypothetical protein